MVCEAKCCPRVSVSNRDRFNRFAGICFPTEGYLIGARLDNSRSYPSITVGASSRYVTDLIPGQSGVVAGRTHRLLVENPCPNQPQASELIGSGGRDRTADLGVMNPNSPF